jgi:glycerol-3-phosphate dehydrogenase (NAD(P)+)
MKVGVLGAGSWGTALAMVLADNGNKVKIWSIIPEQIVEINEKRTNNAYLKDIQIPSGVTAVATLEEAVEGVDFIVMSVPSSVVRQVSAQLKIYC